MTKHRLNTTFILLLTTAFLAIQWSAAHIHLAEHHDHDGSHHQHSIEAHAYQTAGHHADTIDSSHQSGDLSVVEINHEYNTPNAKKKTPTTAAITPAFQQIALSQPININLPTILNTKLSHLYRSTVNLRAPPQLS